MLVNILSERPQLLWCHSEVREGQDPQMRAAEVWKWLNNIIRHGCLEDFVIFFVIINDRLQILFYVSYLDEFDGQLLYAPRILTVNGR